MKKYIFISVFAAALGLSSCVGLEQYPTTSYTDDNFWDYEANCLSALYLGYNQLNSTDYIFNYNLLSDDCYGSRHSSDLRDIAIGTATTDNGTFESLWDDSYQELRTIHTALENIDRMNVDDDTRTRMEAEFRLMRAYTYMRLVFWFGDVPFFTSNPTLEEAQTCARDDADEIWDFIHSELLEAAAVLPKNTEIPTDENGRLTCGAAIGLNARAYLWQNDFANCAKECEKLIGTDTYGTYALLDDYDYLFSDGYYSEESMLTIEFAYDGGVENILRSWSPEYLIPQSIGQGEVVVLSPTQELVDCFKKLDGSDADDTDYDDRDGRFYTTIVYNGATVPIPEAKGLGIIGSEGVGKGTYTCWTNPDDEEVAQATDPNLGDSYQDTDNRTRTGYYMIKNYNAETVDSDGASYKSIIDLRYAEILLMYAESMNEQGSMTSTIWDETIKPLRERAGFDSDYCSYPSSDIQDHIRNEKRCELALEGQRPYDLRRYALLDNAAYPSTGAAYLTSQATGAPFAEGTTIICPTAYSLKYWFAIPQAEMDINSNLTQNPGW